MQTMFTVHRNPTIKEKHKLKLNGMVTAAIMNFQIFHFLLIWYERMTIISEKCNFTLWIWCFLQTFDFKTWIIKTTSKKIHWDQLFFPKGFPSPTFNQCSGVCKLHQDHAADKLLTNNINIGEREGGLNGAIFKLFERNP